MTNVYTFCLLLLLLFFITYKVGSKRDAYIENSQHMNKNTPDSLVLFSNPAEVRGGVSLGTVVCY